MERLGVDRPVSMKLMWRAELSALSASSSWVTPRSLRQPRSRLPTFTSSTVLVMAVVMAGRYPIRAAAQEVPGAVHRRSAVGARGLPGCRP